LQFTFQSPSLQQMHGKLEVIGGTSMQCHTIYLFNIKSYMQYSKDQKKKINN